MPRSPGRLAMVAACSAAMVLLTGADAYAQVGALGRAAQGLFRGAPSDSNPRQRLDVTLSLAEAYDDDAMADLRPGITPNASAESGFYTSLAGDIDYRRRIKRLQLSAGASSAFRYYGSTGDFTSVSHGVDIAASARMFGRSTFQATGSVGYSPSYLYGLFADGAGGIDVPPPTAPDYTNYLNESYSYRASVGLNQPVARSGSLSVSGNFSTTDYAAGSSALRDTDSIGLQARYGHTLSRRSQLNATYTYRVGEFGYGLGGRSSEHTVRLGVAYNRPLSTARSALVQFSLGATTVDVPATGFIQGAGPAASASEYRLSGDIALGYQFRRGWQVRGDYRRSVEYIPDFVEPVFLDGVGLSVDGVLSRRLDFDASARYSDGASARRSANSDFDTYTGTAQLRYALARSVAVYAQYFYYFYDFTRSAQLAPGIPAQLERNGVRVGVTVRMSALER